MNRDLFPPQLEIPGFFGFLRLSRRCHQELADARKATEEAIAKEAAAADAVREAEALRRFDGEFSGIFW
jgi:hypothetical protein